MPDMARSSYHRGEAVFVQKSFTLCGDQSIRDLGTLRVLRYTIAERQFSLAAELRVVTGDGAFQPRDREIDLPLVGTGHHNQELHLLVTEHHVRPAKRVLHKLRRLIEELLGFRGAKPVADRLEIGDVQNHEGKSRSETLRPSDLVGQHLFHGPPIEKLRGRVNRRYRFHPFVEDEFLNQATASRSEFPLLQDNVHVKKNDQRNQAEEKLG